MSARNLALALGETEADAQPVHLVFLVHALDELGERLRRLVGDGRFLGFIGFLGHGRVGTSQFSLQTYSIAQSRYSRQEREAAVRV